VSPPQFALLFQPWLALPAEIVGWAWLATGATALGITAVAAFRHVGLPVGAVWPTLAAALLLLWPANAYGLELGQNSVVVALLLTLAGATASAASAGALLAFAAVMKPHLTIILLAGLALAQPTRARGTRLLAMFFLVSCGLLAMTVLYSRRWIDVLLTNPPESWNYWGSTVGLNLFLVAALDDGAAATLAYGVITITLVTGLTVWVLTSRPSAPRLLAALLPAALLLTPYAYPHDYVILAYCIVWAAAVLMRLRSPLGWATLLGVLAIVWFAPMPARYDDLRFVSLAAPAILLALAFGLPAADRTRRTPS
jgi:Glycosyltransferase family 87